MPETLALTNPIPATTSWRVKEVNMSLGLSANAGVFAVDPDRAYIDVVLIGDNGRRLEHRFTGLEAHNDIVGLNKANLSGAGGSLQKRVLNKLIAAGVIAGTVQGTPD
jgi:hypothetical protein